MGGARGRRSNDRSDFYSSSIVESRRNPLLIAPNMRVAGRVTGTGTFTVDEDSLALEAYCESLQRGQNGNNGRGRAMRGTSNQELFPSLSSALSQSSLDDMNSEYEQLTKVNNDTTTKDTVQMYVGNLPEDFEVEVFQNIVDAFGGQSIGIKLVMDK